MWIEYGGLEQNLVIGILCKPPPTVIADTIETVGYVKHKDFIFADFVILFRTLILPIPQLSFSLILNKRT